MLLVSELQSFYFQLNKITEDCAERDCAFVNALICSKT